ncbi:aspartate kinase homoserine dehydrogenase [Heliocybe sulcata]|uniref:Homoserine dehydrogenase n=1 Tax=Heliocybe sulcata TaxID=5364 RepID=A0A5C3MYX4_9AGAM|nr:aspartate kinase homoserine dehydrogenase [Heliocybe sulcata]
MSSLAPSNQTIRVAVIGVGLVGAEFVDQLLALATPNPFRIVSLSSSKNALLGLDGLSFTEGWRSDLWKSGKKPGSFADLAKELSKLVVPNQKVVLVDNTANEAVAASYPLFLKAGINVITPNKKAFSGDLRLYDEILSASAASGARFLNESTVGAGLPIISTLKDLVMTGDTVHKIEGVFSGTMSYIFNEFSPAQGTGPAFSSVVRIAREKGYTEPHPADDLNGADVGRKLTILSRYIPALRTALPSGYKSVSTRSLVPGELENTESGDEFIEKLPAFDEQFDKMRKEASAEDKVLRFVGVVDVKNGVIKADLEKYPNTHPFATSLGGSDNIIMFHTERYGARPLIVQGAGAGAAVTAMGVMSDLLKLV